MCKKVPAAALFCVIVVSTTKSVATFSTTATAPRPLAKLVRNQGELEHIENIRTTLLSNFAQSIHWMLRSLK